MNRPWLLAAGLGLAGTAFNTILWANHGHGISLAAAVVCAVLTVGYIIAGKVIGR